MSTDKMREEFEAWWVSRPFRKKPETYPDGTYKAPAVMIAWTAWQASRAALVVELPQPFEGDDFTMYDGKELRAAREAVGVRVRA